MYGLILAIVKRIESNVILRYTRTQLVTIVIITFGSKPHRRTARSSTGLYGDTQASP